MTIEWPHDDDTSKRRPAQERWLGTQIGAIRFAPNDWATSETERPARYKLLLGAALMLCVLLAIGVTLWLFSPLPRLFPEACSGCVVVPGAGG